MTRRAAPKKVESAAHAAADEIADIIVVGAGPAGLAAALHACALGRAVTIVEKEKSPLGRDCAGWISPAGADVLTGLGVKVGDCGGGEFRGLRLFSWDLRKNTTVKPPEIHGWIVDRARMAESLLAAAAQAGARLVAGATVEALALNEDRAVLRLSSGASISGRILIIADGAQSATARLANLAPAGRAPGAAHGFFATAPVEKGPPSIDLAIGAGRALQLATMVRLGPTIRVGYITKAPIDTAQEQYRAFISSAAAAGLVPAGGLEKTRLTVLPVGLALDLDSHVGKRCLMIGDAGGFVAAFSGEGIYPALRSGLCAAVAADQALKAKWVQDELATFDELWRTALADYLRMPNTDLALLMPLVFNNAQMSLRVARAFVLGQQF